MSASSTPSCRPVGSGVEVDGEKVELDAGDYIAFDAVAPHSYTALDGPVRSVLLLQYRGGQQPELVAPHPTGQRS